MEIVRTCRTCEFSFPEHWDEDYTPIGGFICAAHDSLNGYGSKINDLDLSCDQWGISFDYFLELSSLGIRVSR